MAGGNSIGMSVPGASALGLGSALSDQVKGETDEQRKKRMMAEQQSRLMGTTPGASSLGLGGLGGM